MTHDASHFTYFGQKLLTGGEGGAVQCSPWAQQSPARPGPGPWAQGPAGTQPVQINVMMAQARPGPYNISPSHYHINLTIVIKAPMTYF